MLRRTLLCIVALLALLVSASPSEARGGRSAVLPCVGTRVIKVAPLPGYTDRYGNRADLGYAISMCASGQWVRYMPGYWQPDSRLRMARFEQPELASLVRRGVLPEMPTEPAIIPAILRNPEVFWREWLWAFAVGMFGIFAVTFKRLNNSDVVFDGAAWRAKLKALWQRLAALGRGTPVLAVESDHPPRTRKPEFGHRRFQSRAVPPH